MRTRFAIASTVLALALAGCGDDDAETVPNPADPPTSTGNELDATEAAEPVGDPEADESPEDLREKRLQREIRQATKTYRAYIRAINDSDGEALCELIAPGFEKTLKPPEKGDCAESIGASIGFADRKRGYPVWKRTIFTGIDGAFATIGYVQLTPGIITEFADRTEPSVESDIAYLVKGDDGDWVLAKATGALYRAVGKPDFPPRVISPPDDFPEQNIEIQRAGEPGAGLP